ncbi:glycosyltransferase involved in cell wall biosynthesis [Bacillus niacini]|uniref:Glycosyltransferase involved in cell wall biosynthesis n=1 Tax=Neobacillus niacini TaxID=86668 RepID=A0A852TAV0_9BACI|nr:glycosyltransferase family 4 protein [Neobacillus niacini]NYE05893.1 glycosyltransferase involved in cell wall biosynthesis [Neobacillus niacini]
MIKVVENMHKVYLADNSFSGHHKVYLDSLLAIDSTIDISIETKFNQDKININYYLDRYKFINNITSMIEGPNNSLILHLLYIDNLYTNPVFPSFLKNHTIIGTLHHYPQNKIKMKLLKIFSRKITLIIVHSEYIKNILKKNGISNVEVVHYPSFYEYEMISDKYAIKKDLGIPTDKIVLSALGGTRSDKGLDILLESFKYIPDDIKRKVLLNIVGKEETYNEEFINEKIKNYGINSRIYLDFVSDEDFISNVLISDFIILPYRKFFTGNSGPMTESIRNNIPVIGPDYGNLGYLINKYNLGYTFDVEDPISLATTITNGIENKNRDFKSKYSEYISVEKFKESYKNLYKGLAK